MAEPLAYRNKISTCHAITWSKDNRIAFCTDDSINCLTLSPDVSMASTKARLVQTSVPADKEVWDIPKYSTEDHIKIINQMPRDLFSEMSIDPVMNPFEHVHDSSARRGFKVCVWSPLGADQLGRSVLATLSYDHRLCIFSQIDSFIKWKKVAELSKLHYQATKPPESCRKPESYVEYRNWCYSHVTTAVDWYECLIPGPHADQRFALLAAGMHTGTVVIWKIALPVTDKSDCSIIQEIDTVHTKQVKGLIWAPERGLLSVAYVDGRVHLLNFDLSCHGNLTTPPRTLCLHGDADLMPVSSMIYLPQTKDSCWLLVNKEQYYLLYLLQHTGNHGDKVKVIHSSHLIIDCLLHSAGIFVLNEGCVVSISADKVISKIILSSETQEASIESVIYQLSGDDNELCLGACISPNKLLVAFVLRPKPGFDHLAVASKRRYTNVYIRWLDEANLGSPGNGHCIDRLLDTSVSLGEEDILERFRQSLFVPDISVTLTLLDERSRSCHRGDYYSLLQSEMRLVQLKRYACLVTIHILRSKLLSQFLPLECEKERLSVQEKQLFQFTHQTVALHCIRSLQNFVKGDNCDQEEHHREAALMLQYVERHAPLVSERLRPEIADLRKSVETKTGRPVQDRAVKCAICAANMSLTETQAWRCTGGHTLAACPMTVLPCEFVDYVTCNTCKTAVQHPDVVRGYPWVLGDPSRCVLCEERLAVT